MANTPSARKNVRQIAKRTAVNRARFTRIRGVLKKVASAIESGDKKSALAAFRAAQPELMAGASKGYVHRNTLSRTLSRLSKRIKDMPASS